MGDQIASVSSAKPLDPETLRRRINELTEIHRNSNLFDEKFTSEDEDLLKICVTELEGKIDEIIAEYSHFDSLEVEDLDALLEHLKGVHGVVEAENAKVSGEVEELKGRYLEDSKRLESNIEWLNCSLDFIESQGCEKGNIDAPLDPSAQMDDHMDLSSVHDEFKILELNSQTEERTRTLRSLQELDCTLKRCAALETIEDALTGLRVIEFEESRIRLSLRTYIPNVENIWREQRVETITDTLEQNHELSIEVIDGTMELKNVEIFPNDVYIGEIIDAAKSFGQLFSPLLMPKVARTSLEWIVRRVQDRIVLCALRRYLVKSAKNSRYSCEYLDRDEVIVAHMAGGIDAFIKVPQGWPIFCSALKLVSLKGSSSFLNKVSSSFLLEVEATANSLDMVVRQSILSFVDAIEEILVHRKLP